MPGSTNSSGRPGGAGEPEGLTPDASPEEERDVSDGPEEADWISTATEDPAWSLKESGR